MGLFFKNRKSVQEFSQEVTPCSREKVDRHFGGIYHCQIRSRKASQERNQFCLLPLSSYFLLGLLYNPEGGDRVFSRTSLTVAGLHGVISPEMNSLIFTAARTPNPTRNSLICYQGSKHSTAQHSTAQHSTAHLHRAKSFLEADNL
jgi:hypothetical protein